MKTAMISYRNGASVVARTQSGSLLGRAAPVALWGTQTALAVTFFIVGSSKLAGASEMVRMFDAIGAGNWLRYLIGLVEVGSGIALLIPSAAIFGALLLVTTMAGAIIANVSVLHKSPLIPLLLLLIADGVAWVRCQDFEFVADRRRDV